MLNKDIKYTSYDYEAIKILSDFLPDRIFDSHMHIYRSDFLPSIFKNSEYTMADTTSYLNAMKPMLCNPKKIRMNIIPYPVDISLADKSAGNLEKSDKFLISELENNPENVGEIIVLPDESASNIQNRLVHSNIKGLKCYFLLSNGPEQSNLPPEKYLPVDAWEVAQKNKMCITLHLARDKSLSDEKNLNYIKTMANRYKDAKLILAHAARGFAAWTCVEAVHELARFDNVLFDFSAICESPAIFQVLKKIGAKKCLWGSDYPACTKHGKVISIADTFYWLGENNLSQFSKMWLIGLENLMAVRQACIMCDFNENRVEDIFYNNASKIWDVDL